MRYHADPDPDPKTVSNFIYLSTYLFISIYLQGVQKKILVLMAISAIKSIRNFREGVTNFKLTFLSHYSINFEMFGIVAIMNHFC